MAYAQKGMLDVSLEFCKGVKRTSSGTFGDAHSIGSPAILHFPPKACGLYRGGIKNTEASCGFASSVVYASAFAKRTLGSGDWSFTAPSHAVRQQYSAINVNEIGRIVTASV